MIARPVLAFALFFYLGTIATVAAAEPTAAPGEKKPAAPAPFVRRASTGHVTNYDEAKVPPFTLPDLLVCDDGTPVRDARTWQTKRRPEILRHYESEIFGRVPADAPKTRVEVFDTGETVAGGAGRRKRVVVHFGPDENGPKAEVALLVPAKALRRSPVLLQLTFFPWAPADAAATGGRRPPFAEAGPIADILQRGYAYALFRYTDVQPDQKLAAELGVQGLTRAPGQGERASDAWGTIAAWSWAASRVLDALAADPELDATRVAIIGHSRLGKTALWAGATDPRFGLIFSSCSGEMGAALARRDFGESLDDMAQSFPWQFARNFQRFVGKWNELPVDAHCLIALSAPRPVFITGGTEDQWADPKGEFLAEVAAGPVYRLLGKADLGATELPPLDAPLVSGHLGWLYHTGGHSILPGDWKAFLDFADRHLR